MKYPRMAPLWWQNRRVSNEVDAARGKPKRLALAQAKVALALWSAPGQMLTMAEIGRTQDRHASIVELRGIVAALVRAGMVTVSVDTVAELDRGSVTVVALDRLGDARLSEGTWAAILYGGEWRPS